MVQMEHFELSKHSGWFLTSLQTPGASVFQSLSGLNCQIVWLVEFPPEFLGCRTFEQDVIQGCEALTAFTHMVIMKCPSGQDNMVQVLPWDGHSCIIWNDSGNPPTSEMMD